MANLITEKEILPGKPSFTGQDLHHPNCFACGTENPHSLRVSSLFDEENGEVRFEYELERVHEGAPGHSHGGVLATILDEAQGVLCHHLGHFVMTDHFTIKYHKATPLFKKLYVRAWLTTARRRRLYTRASISLESGELLVESSIRWYILPEKVLVRKFDFSSHAHNADKILATLEANRLRARKLHQEIKRKKQLLGG